MGANAQRTRQVWHQVGSDQHGDPRTNRLLAALPTTVYATIAPLLESVVVPQGHLYHEALFPIATVVFPLTAVASLVVDLEDGSAIEAATVGNDGFVGVPLALGLERDTVRVVNQVPGLAVQLPAAAFRRLLLTQPELHALTLRYVATVLLQMSRAAACNRAHALKDRVARWLLEIHDRAGRDQFPLTHEYLATMLGVRRATVTEAAGVLQAAGLIQYRRGVVVIRDRTALERLSCDCYAAIRILTDRFLG